METLEAVRTRRSVRKYKNRAVPEEKIRSVLEAGRWAPSGMNNEPWRFAVLTDKRIKEKVAEQTRYGDIIKSAPCAIAVFYDQDLGYDRTKDILAIGACIQNMLLAAHSLGLGACWLGEILKNRENVSRLCEAPENYELTAVITLGEPAENPGGGERRELNNLVYKWT